MRTVVLLIFAFSSALAIRQRSGFTRYRSWNSRMYPVWQDGDPRFRNCWFGGEVSFDLKNDAPTLTGAKATFTINLNFPPNQTTLPDGQVVWARNCTVEGREYQEGQAVYPEQDPAWTGAFPDGTPITGAQNRKPRYVFVWKTWGRYWQVADGPSSSLTIGTDNVALGSYNMEVVIYHCRGRDRFIPLGYASTVFSITDQVPFSLSLAQVNDVNQNDQNFIQNQAIAFTATLHDPSQYLSNADISFTWDFGDNSGTLISRERTVTHTYLSVGTFKPQVILMATIPNTCGNPTAVAPVDASAAPAVVVMASTAAAVPAAPAEGGDAIALDVPSSDATPLAASAQPADAAANADDEQAAAETDTATAAAAEAEAAAAEAETDGVEVNADEADAAAVDVAAEEGDAAATVVATVAPVAPAAEEAVNEETAVEDNTVVAAASAAPAAEGETEVEAATVAAVADTAAVQEADVTAAAAEETAAEATAAAAEETAAAAEATAAAVDETAAAADATEAVQAETEAPVDNVVALAATEATVVEEAEAADAEAEVVETVNAVAATAAAAEAEVVPAEGEVQAEVEADPAQVALVLVKRQAPELAADCTVYRYGSLATSVDVAQGIESVEIVQVSSVVSMATALDQNAVDVTISCQGSLPSEVCTVVSDADCITPVQTICNAASPSPDCQLILRQFFNDTGVFCLNVSLTNDVSLAMTSARVNVAVASGGSPAGTAATVLGVMVLACVVCCVGLMYRRFKQYQPLSEGHEAGSSGSFGVTSVPLLLWNLLSRQSPGESRPLLQGRIV
ncbi:premelanosome protein a [Oryzias melastigma]|uniref:premelanosome protein a n=1 Tax=Oryzias melastigma TaxID=30732 RepID=UPI00168D4E2B|nr:premelanosome protein a [Oryzias melastigma]